MTLGRPNDRTPWTVVGPGVALQAGWELLDVVPAQNAVVLDDDLLTVLDKRAKFSNTDRAGYLRWVLTGKEPKK